MFKKKGIIALASATTIIGGLAAQAVPVFAAVPDNGTTPVTYDNRQVLPDDNAQYGMIIPTSISFTDAKKKADASVEITGINGYDLDKDWNELDVTATVASKNSYKLKDEANHEVDYELKMEHNGDKFEANETEQDVTMHFGVGVDKAKKEVGTATLTGKATVKGQYKDSLTYKFTENKNERK